MNYQMFPQDEVITMSDNVFIHKPKHVESKYKVWLVVGVQYFSVGESYDDIEAASWHAKMLMKAVNRLKGVLC